MARELCQLNVVKFKASVWVYAKIEYTQLQKSSRVWTKPTNQKKEDKLGPSDGWKLELEGLPFNSDWRSIRASGDNGRH
jgi:hypothetical protein